MNGIKRRSAAAGFLLSAMLLSALAFPIPVLAAESGAEINIPVNNSVTGDIPSVDETYSFSLKADDGAPMPAGSENGMKTVRITGGGSALFGQIRYTELGEYHYTIRETPGNNQRYTYDSTVYSAAVQVTWKDKVGGEMEAVMYLTKGDGADKQGKVLFANQYKMPSPVSVDPYVQKTVQGSPVLPSSFSFRMTASDKRFPMPAGSTDGMLEISLEGQGSAEFGIITYQEPGEYQYFVYEENNGISGYTYDRAMYTMTVTVTESDGKLSQTTQFAKTDGTVTDSMSFVNLYRSGFTLPKTGDKANVALWAVLAVLAVSAAAIAGKKKK